MPFPHGYLQDGGKKLTSAKYLVEPPCFCTQGCETRWGWGAILILFSAIYSGKKLGALLVDEPPYRCMRRIRSMWLKGKVARQRAALTLSRDLNAERAAERADQYTEACQPAPTDHKAESPRPPR